MDAVDLAAVNAMSMALLDLWANIGPREIEQLEPSTIKVCQFVHERLEHWEE